MITNKSILHSLIKEYLIEITESVNKGKVDLKSLASFNRSSIITSPILKCYLIKDEKEGENSYFIYDSMYKIKVFFNKAQHSLTSYYFPTNYLDNIDNSTILIKSYKIDFGSSYLNWNSYNFDIILLVETFVIDPTIKNKSSIKNTININNSHEIEYFKQVLFRCLFTSHLNEVSLSNKSYGLISLFNDSNKSANTFLLTDIKHNYIINDFNYIIGDFDDNDNELLDIIHSDNLLNLIQLNDDAKEDCLLGKKRENDKQSNDEGETGSYDIEINLEKSIKKEDYLSVCDFLTKSN